MKENIQRFKKHLIMKYEALITILQDYQPKEVTEYEIQRCLNTIEGLHHNDQYLNYKEHIDSMAVMLPSNLPLYSLFIFAIIPSLLTKQVNVRPNSILQEHNIISRLYDELELENLFPELNIINQDHAGFEAHIKNADLVVFTGKPSNSSMFLKKMKPNSILVINGAGHNPLIITETADIDKAVEGALLLKGFNGGQDCAGPDAILVHHKISQQFIEQFQYAFTHLKTGKFDQPDTVVGPIHRFSELQRLAGLMHQNRADIIAGGTIDFKHSIINPTVIVRGIERYPNYQEIYGPITFIHPYKEDSDLHHYFENSGQYSGNRMYVTVYGHSDYACLRDDATNPGVTGNIGIVLKNKTIHDVEIGYEAYGGYSLGASGLIKKTSKGNKQVAMPILLPQIIVDYLIHNKDLPKFKSDTLLDANSVKSLRIGKEIEPVISEFKSLVMGTFNNTIAFAFVFGSAAKGKLKVQKDDLDTFICLYEANEKYIASYKHQLVALHNKHELKVDETYPAEIMTLETLQKAIEYVRTLEVSIYKPITGAVYDNLFWVHALSDQKTGFIGDGKLMASLIKQSHPNILRWRDQIITQIQAASVIPDHILKTFSGLSKEQIIDKFKELTPHLVVHLGLNYDADDNHMALSPSAVVPHVSFFAPLRDLAESTSDLNSENTHNAMHG